MDETLEFCCGYQSIMSSQKPKRTKTELMYAQLPFTLRRLTWLAPARVVRAFPDRSGVVSVIAAVLLPIWGNIDFGEVSLSRRVFVGLLFIDAEKNLLLGWCS